MFTDGVVYGEKKSMSKVRRIRWGLYKFGGAPPKNVVH